MRFSSLMCCVTQIWAILFDQIINGQYYNSLIAKCQLDSFKMIATAGPTKTPRPHPFSQPDAPPSQTFPRTHRHTWAQRAEGPAPLALRLQHFPGRGLQRLLSLRPSPETLCEPPVLSSPSVSQS